MNKDEIKDVIADLKKGKMVIILDDEDRENEGDLICAAEAVTPEIVNFMATNGRGLICLECREVLWNTRSTTRKLESFVI